MIKFYLIRREDTSRLESIELHHDGCMNVVMSMPVTTLTKDVEAWRDGAKHGDTFRINYDRYILALDLANPPKPITVEVCERLCDHHLVPEFKDGQYVRHVEAPKYHACLAGDTSTWAAGTSPDEAIGDLVRCHPDTFGINVTYLEGKQAR